MPPATDAPPLRVAVLGAGAVGSFLGGTLAAAGSEVTLLVRHPFAGGDAGSLELVGPGTRDRRTVAVRRVTDPAGLPAQDLVLVAVKTFDLPGALEGISQAWPSPPPLLTVQNGVGAEELASVLWTGSLLAGSLTTAVETARGGAMVLRRRTGGIGIAVVREADPGGGTALAARLAAAWSSAGLPAVVEADWRAMKWSKLLANLVGNASSAILDLDPGAVWADPDGFRVERAQLREAVAAMRAAGLPLVRLPGADVSLLLRGLALPAWIGRPLVARAIAGARGGKSPSLRLHVRGGGEGPTEARWLNGAVAAEGARLGAPAPVNAALARLVDEVAADPARAAWFAGRPDRLAAAAGAV